MKYVALLLIRGYQFLLSPLVGNQCRFQPSCSHYTHEAIEKHGVIKGAVLGIRRILRCRPGAKWGYDPVPPSTPSTIN